MVADVKHSMTRAPNGPSTLVRAFRALCSETPLSRGALRRGLAVSPSTVTDAVATLMHLGFVREVGHADSTGGRPAGLLELSPALGGVLAADVGGLRIRVAAADLLGRVIAQRTYLTPVRPTELRRALVDALGEMKEAHPGPSRALCVSIAGAVNPKTGEISATNNIAGWRDPTTPAWLGEVAQPLLIENEANMAAFGEYHHGAARGTRIALFIALGAGIGAGLILSGELFRGASGAAGEIGLSVSSSRSSARVLEQDLSGPALLAAYGEAGGHALDNPSALFGLAQAGDMAAVRVVNRALDRLAINLSHVLLMVNPDRVIIGGGLATAGELLLSPLRRRTQALLRTAAPEMVLSELGPDAALMGAATWAAEVAVERLAAELAAGPAGQFHSALW